jgi:NAD-dependent SIR2 family protein deacetylase
MSIVQLPEKPWLFEWLFRICPPEKFTEIFGKEEKHTQAVMLFYSNASYVKKVLEISGDGDLTVYVEDYLSRDEKENEAAVKKIEGLIRQNHCPVCASKITANDVNRFKDPARRCAKCEQELRDKLPPRYDDGPSVLRCD